MAKEQAPAMPFYVREYWGDLNVQAMTWEQRGIYVHLLLCCWTEGSIPSDPDELCAILHVTRKKLGEVWPRIRRCFCDGTKESTLVHNKVEQIRLQKNDYRQACSEKGKAGNAKRWASRDLQNRVEDSAISQRSPSESPSESPSDDPAIAQRVAKDRFPTSDFRIPIETTNTVVSKPTPTPPCREGGSALARTGDIDAEQWREYLGVFVACGKPLNESDIGKALRLWSSTNYAERATALEDAKQRAMTSWRAPDLTQHPANHLREKPWTRTAGPRLLPTPRPPGVAVAATGKITPPAKCARCADGGQVFGEHRAGMTQDEWLATARPCPECAAITQRRAR